LDERKVSIGINVRVHHRVDDCAGPFTALDEGAGHLEMGAFLGNAGLDGVFVAARRPCTFAVFAPVGIFLARPAACAAFGKIIVPCAIQGGTPCRCVPAPQWARHRLRQNAGRVRTAKSNRLHGAHYTPARRMLDKPGEGAASG